MMVSNTGMFIQESDFGKDRNMEAETVEVKKWRMREKSEWKEGKSGGNGERNSEGRN